KTQVGTGDRSAMIRTYNFPQSRVTDHRIGLTLHQLQDVLNGDLDELIGALKLAREAERLEGAVAGRGWRKRHSPWRTGPRRPCGGAASGPRRRRRSCWWR